MKVLLTLTTLLLLFAENAYFQKQLSVQILYESLCPDSYSFITKQLYPAWKDVAPYVDLKFIPFGKSISLEDKESFQCQHGVRECIGNRIQSCALSGIKSADDQVKYVNCFMETYFNNRKNTEFGEKCTQLVGLNWTYVENCYESDFGTVLQLQAEMNTAKFSPSFIPTIIYNGVFGQTHQDLSLVDFKGVVLNLVNT